MPAQPILIISKDKDFSSVVADQVRRELSLAVTIAENSETVNAAQASVIVTSEGKIEDAPCPVILIENPPIRLPQLLENIAAIVQKENGNGITFGQGYSLQLRHKQLTYSGKTVDLTDKEARLLQYLAEAGDNGMPKDQLLKSVWGIEAELNTHTLETHIYRLRGKCKELSGDELIAAMEGGYRLAK